MRLRNGWFLILALATTPLWADGRGQSYITYDNGGTIVRQGSDGREISGRVNVPIFPGDELRTERRARSEVRLSDGNVVAVDGSTTIRFDSMYDSYEGDNGETVAQLQYGEVILHRLARADESVRLDTDSASYIASRDSIVAVQSDGRSHDLVSVFEGSVEIRTPDGTTRLRAGEQGRVDHGGLYDTNRVASSGTTDFERWYLRRADRYGRSGGRYLDRSLSYAESDLDGYGNWVWVDDYGSWVWRPHVSVGWRPYYYGSWTYSPGGCLVWVSDEPWGWVPYHYGRWAFSPGYGWVWLPGYGYSHAWVYWAFGDGYVGWAPSGWYDCYSPYYSWLYSPYYRYNVGFGFYGRVRLSNSDLRGWIFTTPGTLVSTRVDRAALATDRIRERLQRGGGMATIGTGAIRLGGNGVKDPSTAIQNIIRRSGDQSGDLSSFFRRDPNLPAAVRDRVSRTIGGSAPAAGGNRAAAGSDGGSRIARNPMAGTPSSTRNPGVGSGSRDRSGSNLSGRINRDPVAGAPSSSRNGSTGSGGRERIGSDPSGRINRGGDSSTQTRPSDSGRVIRTPESGNGSAERGTVRRQPTIPPTGQDSNTIRRPAPPADENRNNSSWREGSSNRSGGSTQTIDRNRTVDRPSTPRGDDDNPDATGWRGGRVIDRTPDTDREDSSNVGGSADRSWRGGGDSGSTHVDRPRSVDTDRDSSDVPRRVIDRIGGARVSPSESRPEPRSSGESSGRVRTSPPSSGGSSSPRSSEHSSPPPRSSNDSSSSDSHTNIKPHHD